jgi:hypothetical protein
MCIFIELITSEYKNIVAKTESSWLSGNSFIVIVGSEFSVDIKHKSFCVSFPIITILPVNSRKASTDSIFSCLEENEGGAFIEDFVNEYLLSPAIARPLEDIQEPEITLTGREVIKDLQCLVFVHDCWTVLRQFIDTIFIWIKSFLDLLLSQSLDLNRINLLIYFSKFVINLFELKFKSSLIERILHVLNIFQFLGAFIIFLIEFLRNLVSKSFWEVTVFVCFF